MADKAIVGMHFCDVDDGGGGGGDGNQDETIVSINVSVK